MASRRWRFLTLIVSALAVLAHSSVGVRADALGELVEQLRKSGIPGGASLIDSARSGNPVAQTLVGEMLIDGRYSVSDANLGAEFIEKAARNGHAVAASYLARLYDIGRLVPKDIARAAYWYEKAYEGGQVCAALELAYLSFAIKPRDAGRAVPWFEKCAANGLRICQERLAYLYLYSPDVPRDYAKSLRWLQEATKPPDYSGSPSRLATLQMLIGVQFEKGLGTPKNVPEAIEWYGRAASAGNAYAQYALARFYEAGIDVPVDVGRAVQLLDKAALAGYAPAQYRLALAYERGTTVPADRTLAVKWLMLALADRGSQPDQLGDVFGPNGADSELLSPITRTDAERDLARLKSELSAEQAFVAETGAANFAPELGVLPYCGPHGCPTCW